MAIISSNQAARFVRNPPPELRGALCYGPDRGLVKERALQLSQAFLGPELATNKMAVTNLYANDLTAEPGYLTQQLSSVGLFVTRRVVRVSPGSVHIDKEISSILPVLDPELLLIVEAEKLTPKAPLRRLFESDSKLAAIACYADEEKDINRLIRQEVSRTGLTIEEDACRAMAELLGADRAATRQEIEKLLLYVHGRDIIQLADVMACVGDVSTFAFDHIFDNAALGVVSSMDRALHQAFAQGVAARVILSLTQRHFLMLHGLRAQMEAGRDVKAAVAQLRPPIFFKRRDAIVRQCRRWLLDELEWALAAVKETEKITRHGEAVSRAAIGQLLLAISAKQNIS